MLRFRISPPARSARLVSFDRPTAAPTSRRSVYEVHPSTHQPLSAEDAPFSDRFPAFSSHAVHTPPDHDGSVWAVSSDAAPMSSVSSPFAPHATHVPSDHDARVWAVSSSEDPIRSPSEDPIRSPSSAKSLIPEQGPGLVDGIITVDDASYTTQILTHCGPATSAFGCVALLDTGSPQSFVSASTWAAMKASGAASSAFGTRTQPRCWGGF